MRSFDHLYAGGYAVEWEKNAEGNRIPTRILIRSLLPIDPKAEDFSPAKLRDLEESAELWAAEHQIDKVLFVQVFL